MLVREQGAGLGLVRDEQVYVVPREGAVRGQLGG
jgi:hypothetical protein